MSECNPNFLIGDGFERVSASVAFLGVSRSSIYKLIHGGLLPSIKVGKSRRLPIRAVRQLALEQLVALSVDQRNEPPCV
ncbi:MAG TPA: helix-turn-helix domain-containing protein [Gemmataceae bacterium]|jgi:excisionase family DNA binding protein|nr:helix-turn-helix domain-containing protein [Gemmataceae bacterium]